MSNPYTYTMLLVGAPTNKELLCIAREEAYPSNPFFCFIETAYGHGIIAGYSDGTFHPNNNVTRAQLCKIIVLAMGWTTS